MNPRLSQILERRSVEAAAVKAQRLVERNALRLEMPIVTAFIDDMRAVFGAPAYINAKEGGREVVWGVPSHDRATAYIVQPAERWT